MKHILKVSADRVPVKHHWGSQFRLDVAAIKTLRASELCFSSGEKGQLNSSARMVLTSLEVAVNSW